MILSFVKLHPQAVLPAFAHDDDACFDITCVDRSATDDNSRIYSTGLAPVIPKGYYVELAIRSSLAFNHDMILSNGVGIIDAGYRGEIKLKLTHIGMGRCYWPVPGDRIAQGRLVRLTKTQIEWTDSIDETERGSGGFGSTGS